MALESSEEAFEEASISKATFLEKAVAATASAGCSLWLAEEGLPTAEMEAKALGGDMDKEAVMRRAMEKWRRMSVEEKAVWRARAKEDAKKVRAKEDTKEAKAKEEANTNQK